MAEIVVGADRSAATREALLWSLEQGIRTGSAIIALCVWRKPLELEIPFDFETISSLGEDLSHRSIVGLPQITAASMPGDPGPVLVDRARKADLLVVGARHHPDLRGSVSSYCLHHSHTPVAVIPGDASTRSSRRQQRVVVGVNLTPESAVALKWASREASSRDAELVVAHAWHVAPGSLADLAHHANTRRAQEGRADQELQNWVSDVLGPAPPTPVHLYAEHGGPLDTLMTHAEDADLLVLGSRGHHPLARLLGGSMSGPLSIRCACPIIVVPQSSR
jgi:nucleotide-binding universal stress UspA family protein